MNIFDHYLDEIKSTLINLSKNGEIILPKKLEGVTTEIPPIKFNSDISTNIAMVLSKANKKSPIDLAKIIARSIKENDELIEDISIANPGFINIKFKTIFWTNFVKDIIDNSKSFGINTKEKKKNIWLNLFQPTQLVHYMLVTAEVRF